MSKKINMMKGFDRLINNSDDYDESDYSESTSEQLREDVVIYVAGNDNNVKPSKRINAKTSKQPSAKTLKSENVKKEKAVQNTSKQNNVNTAKSNSVQTSNSNNVNTSNSVIEPKNKTLKKCTLYLPEGLMDSLAIMKVRKKRDLSELAAEAITEYLEKNNFLNA